MSFEEQYSLALIEINQPVVEAAPSSLVGFLKDFSRVSGFCTKMSSAGEKWQPN